MSTPQHNPNHGPLARKDGLEYQQLERIILARTKVDCTVVVTPEIISIRAKSYPDFILARNAIKELAGARTITQG